MDLEMTLFQNREAAKSKVCVGLLQQLLFLVFFLVCPMSVSRSSATAPMAAAPDLASLLQHS